MNNELIIKRNGEKKKKVFWNFRTFQLVGGMYATFRQAKVQRPAAFEQAQRVLPIHMRKVMTFRILNELDKYAKLVERGEHRNLNISGDLTRYVIPDKVNGKVQIPLPVDEGKDEQFVATIKVISFSGTAKQLGRLMREI